MIRGDDSREVRDDRQIIHTYEQRREYPEGGDPEERRDGAEAERDGCRDGREEHGEAGLAVAVGEPVGEGGVGEVAGELPRVEEDEGVVGADCQDNEDSEHVEGAEVAVVEDDPVNKVGPTERGDDTEHGETGHPQRPRLDEHEDEDEAQTAERQLQVGHHLETESANDIDTGLPFGNCLLPGTLCLNRDMATFAYI